MTRQNAGLPMAASSWPEPGPFVRRGIILLACAITAFFPCAAQDCVDYRDFPNFVGYYYTRYDRAVYDVDVSGPFAYTIINRWGVRVLDISDPANPVVRGTCQTAYQGTRISVWNSYVVVNSAPGLQLVDTTNPDSLRIVGSLDLDYYVWDFAIAESLAYVAADDGLKVVDLANPEAPELVASLDCFGQTRGVAVDGGYAYVTADSSLRVVDIADPLNPHVVGRLAVGPEAGPISAAGGLACMITQPGFFPDPDPTVHIIDVSNPQEPHWSASIAPSGGAGHIELAGGFAYVTGWGLQIIDISNPNAPRVVGGADPDGESGCGEGLTVKGGYIYVAISGDVEPPDWDGLQIFVANDSRCPEPVGELGESFEVIRVSGSTAYAAVDWHLTTFNIADPQHPEILDTIMLPGYAEDVVIVRQAKPGKGE
jgi:hypothetical protein